MHKNGLANMHKMNSTKGKDQTIEPPYMFDGNIHRRVFSASREMVVTIHVIIYWIINLYMYSVDKFACELSSGRQFYTI